jgi:hypothetical protein
MPPAEAAEVAVDQFALALAELMLAPAATATAAARLVIDARTRRFLIDVDPPEGCLVDELADEWDRRATASSGDKVNLGRGKVVTAS